MNRKTYNALLSSIEHWKDNEKISHIDEADVKPASCALCILYFFEYHPVFGIVLADEPCIGCPIMDATGFDRCRKTPYAKAVSAVSRRSRPKFLPAAKEERLFLQSLVPAGGPDDE